MKVGTTLVAAIAALGLISSLAVLMPDNSEQEKIQAIENNIKVYSDKKMTTEAVKEYQKLLQYEKYSNDYEKWGEYQQYCRSNKLSDEFVYASRKMLALNSDDVQPARDVLDWYKENDSDQAYYWLALLRDNLPSESYKEFGEYYDTIKGNYFFEATGYKELGDWSSACFGKDKNESYLIGKNDKDEACVIGADGNELIKGGFENIYSFSYNERLVAADNDDQIVYVDLQKNRKKVPYDYRSGELLYHNYLGPYYNGIANYCGNDEKWGFLNSNAEIISEKYDYVTSGSEGIFAVKNSNGKWSIIIQNSSGGLERLRDTNYDEIKLDEYGCMTKNGVFFGLTGDSWYLNKIVADEKGNYGIETPDAAYEDVKMFGDLGAVKVSGQWGFVDNTGAMVIEPQFEDAKSFSCGFAAVKKSNQWGYIDKEGKVIINYAFSDANSFSKYGVAAVKSDDEWGLIKLKEYEINGGTY